LEPQLSVSTATFSIGNNDLPRLGGCLGFLKPYDEQARLQDPLFILNPYYPLSNQQIVMRSIVRPSGHIPLFMQLLNIPIIPDILRSIFGIDEPQVWPIDRILPPSLSGNHTALCFIETLPSTSLPGCYYRIPTFRCIDGISPSLRIREESRVVLVYATTDIFGRNAENSMPMLVKGSRGFTPDYHYEILELDFPHLTADDPFKYAWLQIPPQFVHTDVAMVVEPFSENWYRHQELTFKWEREIRQCDPTYHSSDELAELRSRCIWAAMLWYVICRRQQRVK
jgi:hypothetical protein